MLSTIPPIPRTTHRHNMPVALRREPPAHTVGVWQHECSGHTGTAACTARPTFPLAGTKRGEESQFTIGSITVDLHASEDAPLQNN